MNLTFAPDGTGHCLYNESIDLHKLGTLSCRRASLVEFNESAQQWQVKTVEGRKVLFQSSSRQACLDWEQDHLDPCQQP